MLPGAITIISPLVIGFLFGPEALGGFLAGATVSGVLMGMFQNNAGGAWDNAKKSFEKGVQINGEMYYKKSEPHKASVTGDTVGDPFKDTSGPSMNILIKLMSIVSLVIAPTLADLHNTKSDTGKAEKKVEIRVNGSDADLELNNFVEILQKDGYSKNGQLAVNFKEGILIINGEKQTAEIVKKYENFLVSGQEISFEINVDRN